MNFYIDLKELNHCWKFLESRTSKTSELMLELIDLQNDDNLENKFNKENSGPSEDGPISSFN